MMASDKSGSSTSSIPLRKLKFEQLRADYELFLQTFERPTWLYRHMQRRFYITPYMLNRNLSYLRPKSIIKTKKQQDKRKSFKIDNLLDLLEKKEKKKLKNDTEEDTETERYLNISFGGFFHGPGFAEEIFLSNDTKIQDLYKDDFVRVDIHMIKIYNKRKKGIDQPMDMVRLGQCQAPWNPRTQLLLPSPSIKLSVPPSAFQETSRAVKTFLISITVCITVPKKSSKKRGKRKTLDNSVPPTKKLKSNSSDKDVSTPSHQSNKTDSEMDFFIESHEAMQASFNAELIVYDRMKNCLLTEGVYELLLHPSEETLNNKGKSNTWEDNFKSKLGPFAEFSFGPVIKFNLSWNLKPSTPFSTVYDDIDSAYIDPPQPLSKALTNGKLNSSQSEVSDISPTRIFYQFRYNNGTRQQTEAREGLFCPWCALNCKRLYGLMKHLKYSHQRFSFLYTKVKKGHRIDVCINENFESRLDFGGMKDIGFINIDNAPIHRIPQADIVLWRQKKNTKEDLSEFSQPDPDEVQLPSQIHKRIYYHIRSNQQIVNFQDHNCRSEDEMAPDWLKTNTKKMIEEFTDVNEGEKMLMKLWNLFLLEKGYIADFTIANGCKIFVEEYGKQILENRLTRNLILHLNNLIEFQVVSQSAVVKAMEVLYKMKNSEICPPIFIVKQEAFENVV